MPTLNLQVAASWDDARIVWNGSAWEISLDSYLIAGYYSNSQYKFDSGMRFLNVPIPQGAIITAAYLTLRASHSLSVTTVNTRIRGDKEPNAATFSTASDYINRPTTSAVVDWNNIPAWTANVDYQSPDFSSVVQEIINQSGWASGNALVIFWGDRDDQSSHIANCRRNAYDYDNSPTYAAKLHIEYTLPAAGRSRACIIG